MPSRKLLKNWSPEQAEMLEDAIFVAEHRLAELDLFGDAGLSRTLDEHPRGDLGVNTMGIDPCRRENWREGTAGDLSGEDLVNVVRHGRLWLNVRRVMDHHPEYREIVNSLYDELESICDCGPITNRSANLLISSPTALVYYHVDCPANMLWHIHGTKRVFAYPLESGVVSPRTIEAVLAGEKSEEIEYRPELDTVASVVELQPGQMITWPQHTPHRVVNTGGLNVSLSTEHMTRRALRKNNVYLANRHFRHMFGGRFESTSTEGPKAALKELAIRVARRIPPLAPPIPQGFRYPVTFRIDPDAPDGIGLLEGKRSSLPPTIPIVPVPLEDSPLPTM